VGLGPVVQYSQKIGNHQLKFSLSSSLVGINSRQPADHDLSFGYLWWLAPSRGWYIMMGHGNQLVFIIPQKQMIVTFTCLSNLDDDCNISTDYYMDIVDRIEATAH